MYGIWGLVGSKIKVELARRHLPYFLRENGVFFLFFFFIDIHFIVEIGSVFLEGLGGGFVLGIFLPFDA